MEWLFKILQLFGLERDFDEQRRTAELDEEERAHKVARQKRRDRQEQEAIAAAAATKRRRGNDEGWWVMIVALICQSVTWTVDLFRAQPAPVPVAPAPKPQAQRSSAPVEKQIADAMARHRAKFARQSLSSSPAKQPSADQPPIDQNRVDGWFETSGRPRSLEEVIRRALPPPKDEDDEGGGSAPPPGPRP